MRDLTHEQVLDLALGAGVFGGGGGGDPYVAQLMAQRAIRETSPVQVWDVDELLADALVVMLAAIGTSTVMIERLPQGDEPARVVQTLERHLGRPITALVSAEIGGFNGVVPVIAAAHLGLPLIDGDFMGRAFPELQMTLATLSGLATTPMAIVDARGNQVILDTVDNLWAETLARSAVVDMGGFALMALYPMTGTQLRQTILPCSMSRAIRIGCALRAARAEARDPVQAIRESAGGQELFRGKVVDVHRQLQIGFARGELRLEGSGIYLAQDMTIHFQNEYLLATVSRRVVATVPDTIAVLEARSGAPIPPESLLYGSDVVIWGLPCAEAWLTPAGLALVGPRAFGYDVDYLPMGSGLTLSAQR